jgi:hypothetical protein
MAALREWQNFYVIVGSSAGALIGLQFVVMALIANMPRSPDLARAGAAFSTPTIVYFATVLLLAAVLCAPWNGIAPVVVLCGGAGLAGVLYVAIVTRRLRRQTAYKPEFEDWFFHAALPLVAYAALIASAVLGLLQPGVSPFCIAAATLLLLMIGIHNAWDSVTYHVFIKNQAQEDR